VGRGNADRACKALGGPLLKGGVGRLWAGGAPFIHEHHGRRGGRVPAGTGRPAGEGAAGGACARRGVIRGGSGGWRGWSTVGRRRWWRRRGCRGRGHRGGRTGGAV
ncbi:hypothetical protein MNEG_13941, partial [Monoraphidium neglectum]